MLPASFSAFCPQAAPAIDLLPLPRRRGRSATRRVRIAGPRYATCHQPPSAVWISARDFLFTILISSRVAPIAISTSAQRVFSSLTPLHRISIIFRTQQQWRQYSIHDHCQVMAKVRFDGGRECRIECRIRLVSVLDDAVSVWRPQALSSCLAAPCRMAQLTHLRRADFESRASDCSFERPIDAFLSSLMSLSNQDDVGVVITADG